MFSIVGLGNPGKKYQLTRHNVGFEVTSLIAGNDACWRSHGGSRICKVPFGDQDVLVIQPQLFMNKSGEALRPVLDFYRIPSENLIVVYDELDLDPGIIRIRQGGSAGGHRGVVDILRHLENTNFFRVRLGIGHPRRRDPSEPETRQDVSDYVLGVPRGEERRLQLEAVARAEEAIKVLIGEGISAAQLQFHTKE